MRIPRFDDLCLNQATCLAVRSWAGVQTNTHDRLDVKPRTLDSLLLFLLTIGEIGLARCGGLPLILPSVAPPWLPCYLRASPLVLPASVLPTPRGELRFELVWRVCPKVLPAPLDSHSVERGRLPSRLGASLHRHTALDRRPQCESRALKAPCAKLARHRLHRGGVLARGDQTDHRLATKPHQGVREASCV